MRTAFRIAFVCAFQSAALNLLIHLSILPKAIYPQPALGFWYLFLLALPWWQHRQSQSLFLTWVQFGTLFGTIALYMTSQIWLLLGGEISLSLFCRETVQSFYSVPILYAVGSFILWGLQSFPDLRVQQDTHLA